MNESELCQRRGAAASPRAPAPTVCLIPKYADVFLTRQANLDCFGSDAFFTLQLRLSEAMCLASAECSDLAYLEIQIMVAFQSARTRKAPE